MKNLIIGCASNYDWSTLQYWCNSINQSGFDGEKVLVLMNCDKTTVLKVQEEGFKIIAFKKDDEGNLTHDSKMPPHVERFLHIYEYLRKTDPYDWVVTTDVKDVIFQSDPCKALSEMNLDADLYFSSESILYKDEPWGNQNLLDTYGPYVHDIFKENEIYNVGSGEYSENIKIAKQLLSILGLDENRLEFVDERPGHDFRYAIDCTKIRNIGWSPKRSLKFELEKTVSWYMDNKDFWIDDYKIINQKRKKRMHL